MHIHGSRIRARCHSPPRRGSGHRQAKPPCPLRARERRTPSTPCRRWPSRRFAERGLERATDFSPHYAQGIYARAWTEALSGKVVDGRANVDLAMRLSPLDPLHYAMLATRAFTHIALNEDIQAAHWAERGARSPGAHVLIGMIAAATHTLAGDDTRAAFWADNVRGRNDTLTRDVFFRSFPMKSDPMRARLDQALSQLGF